MATLQRFASVESESSGFREGGREGSLNRPPLSVAALHLAPSKVHVGFQGPKHGPKYSCTRPPGKLAFELGST